MTEVSDNAARSSLTDFDRSRSVPPPPAGPSLTSRQRSAEREEHAPSHHGSAQGGHDHAASTSRVFPFDAELEVAEVEYGKAGIPWSARARTLSTSSLSFSSRRMCYVDRKVVIAVHRVDNKPLMLLGRVLDCRYESDGLYTIDLELLPTDDSGVKVSFSRKAV